MNHRHISIRTALREIISSFTVKETDMEEKTNNIIYLFFHIMIVYYDKNKNKSFI